MDSDCWNWLAFTNRQGYGQIGRGTRKEGSVLAHRLSWEIHFGPVPDGLCVLHKCNNPTCVFPGHLFIGTRADNNRHAAECGIKPRGQAHWKSKLTEEQVKAIREMQGSCSEIAKVFGVRKDTIVAIKNRINWAWL